MDLKEGPHNLRSFCNWDFLLFLSNDIDFDFHLNENKNKTNNFILKLRDISNSKNKKLFFHSFR